MLNFLFIFNFVRSYLTKIRYMFQNFASIRKYEIGSVGEMYLCDRKPIDQPGIRDIIFKYPTKSYNETVGISILSDIKENNDFPENFSDSKYLYTLILTDVSQTQTQKGITMRKMQSFYKNLSISYKYLVPLSFLFHLVFVPDLVNVLVISVFFFFGVIWPYFTIFELIEDLDSKYTRHILLEYASKNQILHSIK